jgi:hypothetical protein
MVSVKNVISSHLGLWSMLVTFSLPKESWWPVDLRCLPSGRSGVQFASLLWPFKQETQTFERHLGESWHLPSICLQWSVSKMWFETMYD